MIKFIRKWLQKPKHKHQLPGEKNQTYHVQESTQRQKSQSSNHQRTTERSTKAKVGKLTYEEVFGQATEEYLTALAMTGRLQSFCFLINLEVEAHNQRFLKKP